MEFASARAGRDAVATPDEPTVAPGPLRAGLTLIGLFVALAAAVNARLLAGVDLTLMRAAHRVSSDTLDVIAGLLNYAAAAEVTLAAMMLLALGLLRRGLPPWRAVAPLLFLLTVPLELLLKFTVDQPVPNAAFYRETLRYELTALPVMQSFPSGHAIRTAYLAILLGYLAARTIGWRRAAPIHAALAILVAIEGWTRSYQGHHWPTDVLAGFALGSGVALIAVGLLAPARLGRAAAAKSPGSVR